jgi:hypothetical protein
MRKRLSERTLLRQSRASGGLLCVADDHRLLAAGRMPCSRHFTWLELRPNQRPASEHVSVRTPRMLPCSPFRVAHQASECKGLLGGAFSQLTESSQTSDGRSPPGPEPMRGRPGALPTCTWPVPSDCCCARSSASAASWRSLARCASRFILSSFRTLGVGGGRLLRLRELWRPRP